MKKKKDFEKSYSWQEKMKQKCREKIENIEEKERKSCAKYEDIT